jgi:hypothetical protein
MSGRDTALGNTPWLLPRASTLPKSARLLAGRPAGVPPQTPRRRDHPPRRLAISTTAIRSPVSTTPIRSRAPAIRSALVVTAIWLIATGVFFAFSDDVLPSLIDRQTKVQNHDHIAELSAQIDRMSVQFLHNQQVEQQLTALLNARVDRIEQLGQNISALNELATDTIKQDRIGPPNTLDFAAPSNHEAYSKSREFLATATTKQRQKPRATHQRASLRHRIAAAEHISPQASPVGMLPKSSQLTSVTMKPHAGITDQ